MGRRSRGDQPGRGPRAELRSFPGRDRSTVGIRPMVTGTEAARSGVRAGAPQAPRVRLALVASIAAMAVAPGCGREVVGVAKPRSLRAWEPTPAHPAQMTVVKATPIAVYVGFSDGEVFART